MFIRVPRVYATEDCVGGARQISASVGEGAQAAVSLINEMREEDYLDWGTKGIFFLSPGQIAIIDEDN